MKMNIFQFGSIKHEKGEVCERYDYCFQIRKSGLGKFYLYKPAKKNRLLNCLKEKCYY